MTSRCTKAFWKQYKKLQPADRKQAQKAYQLWANNTAHPGLYFKPLEGQTEDVWSARVGTLRAVCVKSDDTFIWFWVGTHAEFDKEFQ